MFTHRKKVGIMNEMCYNGCGTELPMSDLIQMSSPDGNHLMMVCEDCVHDSDLCEWEVDFVDDPRSAFDRMMGNPLHQLWKLTVTK